MFQILPRVEGRAADKPVLNTEPALEFRRTILKEEEATSGKAYWLPHPDFSKVPNQWLSLLTNSVPHPSKKGLSLRKKGPCHGITECKGLQ